VAWLMISGSADFSTMLKIQQNNDSVKPQVSFPLPVSDQKGVNRSRGNPDSG
jgi:hypothetical protein